MTNYKGSTRETMPQGTPVTIRCQGQTVKRYVNTAINWAGYDELSDNWYIELQDANGLYTGYWKQRIDGGTVEFNH